MNYGAGVPEDAYVESVLSGACPIVGSYDARDRANRGTAYVLAEVEQIADDVLVIVRGRLVRSASLAALRAVAGALVWLLGAEG